MTAIPPPSDAVCNHDDRFKGVFFSRNGCIACECEIQAERASKSEQRAEAAERIANSTGKLLSATLEKLTAAERMNAEYGKLTIIPHLDGSEGSASPDDLRRAFDELQSEWDGAEKRAAAAERERDELRRRCNELVLDTNTVDLLYRQLFPGKEVPSKRIARTEISERIAELEAENARLKESNDLLEKQRFFP